MMSSAVDRVRLLAEVPSLAGRIPPPGLLGARPRFILDDGSVALLDADLRPSLSRRLTVPDGGRLLAATPDLHRVAVLAERLLLFGPDDDPPISLPLTADAVWPVPGGGWLVTAPGPSEPGKDWSESHLVLLLDDSGRERARHVEDAWAAAAMILPHPTEAAAVIEFAMGQDGSSHVLAEVVDGELAVRPVALNEDVCIDFDAAGERLLIAPHPTEGEVARLVGWPGLAESARLDSAQVGWIEEGLDLYGGHLGDGSILLVAREQGVIRTDADLGGAHLLDLPGVADDEFVEWVYPVAGLRFGVGLWSSRGRRHLLYTLDPDTVSADQLG